MVRWSGIPGRPWPGKFSLGHHGDDIEYAPDASVDLEAAMDGSSTMVGALRVVEPIALEAAWEGTSELSGSLGIYHPPSQHPNGSPATPKTPTFRYDGVDITVDVEIKLCEFTASARGNPGTATLRVRNPSIEFVTGKELTCDIGGYRVWGGFVTTVRYGYYFPAAVEQNRFATLQGVDYNVLQQKRVTYDKATPTKTKLTPFPPGTPDSDVIRYYAKEHTDLVADGVNLLVGIEHVGTPSTDDEIRGHAGWTFGEFLQMLRFHTGAIDYIDPDRRFIHTDVDTPNAPFGISDKPVEGEVGCRELEIDFGAEAMRNDALMWGAGQGFTQPVFARETDAASVTEHGLWQVGKMIPTIWRQPTIDQIAESYVYGSPQNKRGGKDDRVAVRCAVFEPGLRVADKVNVRSEVWGFEDVLPIREMRITFPTPTDPRFDLILSHEIDDPWSTFEYFFPQIDTDLPEIPDVEIRLPPVPKWVDEGTGDPVIGVAPPPSCFDGEYAYLIDADENDEYAGWTVRMFASRGTIPADLPLPNHPSGYGAYLLDGTTNGLVGYRWQTADSIIWSGPTPIYAAYATIQQGAGGGVKNLSARLQMYVSPNQDGSGGAIVGDTGEVTGYSDTGPDSLTVSSNNNDPVRYVRVSSVQPAYRVGGIGNFAGNWIVNEARLVGTCVHSGGLDPDNQIRGGSAPGAPTGIVEVPTPEGEDEDFYYYRLAQSWLPGTLMVWINGLLISPDEYEENSVERWIRFPTEILGNIYVRFLSL